MEDKTYWYLVSFTVPTDKGQVSGHEECGFLRPWAQGDTNDISDGISERNGFNQRVSITSVFKLHDE